MNRINIKFLNDPRLELDNKNSITKGIQACFLMNQSAGGYVRDLTKRVRPAKGTTVAQAISPYGRALKFDGANTIVTFSNNHFLDNISPLTCATLCYPVSQGENGLGRFFDKPTWGSFSFGNGPDNLNFSRSASSATSVQRITSVSSMSYNKWQLITGTWDGSVTGTNIHIYSDSTEYTYSSSANATLPFLDDTATAVSIGNRASDLARTFNGNMVYQIWWNRVISSAELIYLSCNYMRIFTIPKRRVVYFIPSAASTISSVRIERRQPRGLGRGIYRGVP